MTAALPRAIVIRPWARRPSPHPIAASRRRHPSPFAKSMRRPYLGAMPMPPLPDLASLSLADIARLVAERRLPPVEQWHPSHCGDSEMRIAADGTWYHQGSPIGRQEMVRLFSTILRREADGSYVLVTPVEKLDIAVDDAPFIAVELSSEGEGAARRLAFRLNSGDLVVADADHPISLRGSIEEPRPYLHVRGARGNGLDALIARPVFYELARIALDEQPADARPDSPVGVWSGGRFFPLEFAAPSPADEGA